MKAFEIIKEMARLAYGEAYYWTAMTMYMYATGDNQPIRDWKDYLKDMFK